MAVLVPDRAPGMKDNPSGDAQAVIGFFPVHEERLVEAPEREELAAPDHHQRAGGRRYVDWPIRSARARTQLQPTVGRRRRRDLHACRLDGRSVLAKEEPGRDRDGGMFEQLSQRLVPARLDLGVVIEKGEQPAARRLGTAVAAAAKT